MFGAPFGALTGAGQLGVDSLMVRPILPWNPGLTGIGVTDPVSGLGGGMTPDCAMAGPVQPNERQAPMPTPSIKPSPRQSAISIFLRDM
jgi:hypothetical protein